jgi:Ras-related protein Rab-2A
VYDVTRRGTFENIKHWLSEARNYGHQNMTYLLIGNKNDLAEKRQVTFDEGANFARQNGLSFLETSAKDNINVKQAFIKTAMVIAGKVKSGQIGIDKSVSFRS